MFFFTVLPLPLYSLFLLPIIPMSFLIHSCFPPPLYISLSLPYIPFINFQCLLLPSFVITSPPSLPLTYPNFPELHFLSASTLLLIIIYIRHISLPHPLFPLCSFAMSQSIPSSPLFSSVSFFYHLLFSLHFFVPGSIAKGEIGLCYNPLH